LSLPRSSLWLVAILVAAGLSVTASASKPGVAHRQADHFSVPPILDKAIQAAKRARYVGRREVQFWRQDQARKHEEIVTHDGQFTRVEFPDGSRNAGQIIVENRDERRHYFPNRNELLVQPPRHEESMERLGRMARQGEKGRLQFTSGPGSRIAGFGTESLTISDLKGNVTQRLFIEPKSGIVLRREVFDPGGAKIGYFEFKQIDINPPPIDPSLFRFERKGVKIVTPYDRLKEIAAKGGFQPLTLLVSSGYRLDEVRVAQIENQDVLVQTFWSHRGKLSLFQLKASIDPDRLKRSAGKDLHTYSWQINGVSLVLVGTASPDELTRLAQMAQNGT
jgi:hypothetical protein